MARRGRSLTCDDALRLLGARDSQLVAIADRLRGIVSVGVSAATLGAVDRALGSSTDPL